MAARRSIRSRIRAPSMTAGAFLGGLEENILRPLPEGHLAECGKLIPAFGDGEEMVAGELAHLAGKTHAAICQENLGVAVPAGIKDDLARCGKARVVLVAEAEIEVAQWDPTRLAAPAHMDDAF